MNKNEKLKAIRDYVSGIFEDDATGHDFFHMQRVAEAAGKIAEKEGANLFISKAAAWVHDIGDTKLSDDPDEDKRELQTFFLSISCTAEEIALITEAARDVSFSKGKVPQSLEGKVVQDADRLDALGAVGIARTFAYGGAKGQLIWHDQNKEGTSIQHFYDKLLKLKGLLNTASAAEIAEERHLFLEQFLSQFFEEWQSQT
ncbi:HD domain-containing protein [Virgibacillus kekensis]|uniref:HD domain-containing protein n=1 Tax=Virgibacillus kekensis TaxID=202261 RepID=A0ABV9DHK5_9BACI